MTRPRHPDKHLEELLREAEDQGWRITKGKRYYKLWCPNSCKHRKTVHLPPSGSRYLVNLRHMLARDTCWASGERGQR